MHDGNKLVDTTKSTANPCRCRRIITRCLNCQAHWAHQDHQRLFAGLHRFTRFPGLMRLCDLAWSKTSLRTTSKTAMPEDDSLMLYAKQHTGQRMHGGNKLVDTAKPTTGLCRCRRIITRCLICQAHWARHDHQRFIAGMVSMDSPGSLASGT